MNPDIRRRVFESNDSKTAINVPILTRILDLRRQIAALLGYETWADYAIENQMAKNSRNVLKVSPYIYYPFLSLVNRCDQLNPV